MAKLATLVVGILLAASPSLGVTAAAHCSASKLKAAAVAARAYARCWADGARSNGGFMSLACKSRALDPLPDRFARSEAAGGCATTDDADEVRAIVEFAVNDVYAFVGYQAGAEACTSRKMRAVGSKLFTIVAAHAKAVRTGDAGALAGTIARAEARFGDAFDAAARTSACANAAATADAVEARLDHPLARLRGELVPVCGDGVAAGSEQCDGPDSYCGTECLPDCTCRPIVCGDGRKEGSEQCDGDDATACPGACASNCRCPSSCGNGVVDGSEQCDGGATQTCGSNPCQAPGLLGECTCCTTGYCSGGFPPVCCGDNVRCVRNAQSPVGVCTPYSCSQPSDCGIGGYGCENGSCCAQSERSCINIGCCGASTCTTASGVPLCCIPSGESCASPHPSNICCSGSCNAGTGLCD